MPFFIRPITGGAALPRVMRQVCFGQVFWLPDHPPAAPSHSGEQWHLRAAFVPGYSGGSATDFHRLPY
jgi:hypothetical protein